MSKIGVMMSANSADDQISSHFGKAEWLMVSDPNSSTFDFVRNEGANGRSAVDIAVHHGLTDVVFTEIGVGAFGRLQAAGIRGWVAPENISGQEAIKMFQHSQLQAVNISTKQGPGHGCCCGSGAGSETTSCCRG